MSRALRTVATIAGAVALTATGIGAFAVPGTVLATTASSVATYATLAATAANIGAQLTAKKPAAKGAVNNLVIASDAPSPYIIGRTFAGGTLRHDVGYGATLNKVKNPYRGMVVEYSVAGPVEELEGLYADYSGLNFSAGAEVGYYDGFMYVDWQLGTTPEDALVPHFAGMPHWGSDYKLSGKAAILWNLKFDRKAKRFASGVPALGGVWKGVKVYDPRLDSTYAGGAGSHRIDDEATWEFSENPGLHGLAYCLGRYRNGYKVFGVGLPADGLMIDHFVTLANVCDANGWTVGGIIYEPGDVGVKWSNLKDILAAGGAEPLFVGGKLGVRINAPGVAIDTITAADLADDDADITAMQTWRDRLNGLIPKYRSEDHKWDYVAAALVSVASYVEEDGEDKSEERQFNLVQDKDQVAQLCGLELVNRREIGPIVLVCKPRMRRYGPGDMLTLDLPEHGLDGIDAVIINRTVDPGRMTVTLTLMSETAGKHDYVLGLTGTAPPTPSLVTPEEKDGVASSVAGNDIDAPTTLAVTPGTGSATVQWRNPTSDDLDRIRIYVGATSDFGAATLNMTVDASGLGTTQSQAVTVAAGTHYFWVVAVSADGYASDEAGPASTTVL